jgi:hypothetical protein
MHYYGSVVSFGVSYHLFKFILKSAITFQFYQPLLRVTLYLFHCWFIPMTSFWSSHILLIN